MYGLPKDFNASFFVGRTLEHVTFRQYAVDLGFDEHVSITVESSLQHQLSLDDVESEVQSIPLSHSRLMQLAGRGVTDVKGEVDGTLLLVFDNRHVLRIFDDRPNYESYSIRNGEQEIIV